LLAGCTGGEWEETDQQESELVKFTNATKWPNGIVPVCWDISAQNHPRFLELSKRFIEITNDHYSRAANLQIEDAGPCPANPKGVIKVFEFSVNPCTGRSCTINGGYHSDSATELHFDWDASWASTPAGVQLEFNHEMAHALTFLHEFNRSGFVQPAGCSFGFQDAGNAPTDNLGTTQDNASITLSSYCNQNTILSAQDIVGLQNAYGTPGALRVNAAATDTGPDTQYHYWNGSTWVWQELFPSMDSLNSRQSVATVRINDRNRIRAFARKVSSGLINHLVQRYWNGSSWDRLEWADHDITLEPHAVAFRNYGFGPTGAAAPFATSSTQWYVFTRDTTHQLIALPFGDNAHGNWQLYGKPAGGNISDVQAVAFSDWGANYVYAFVKAADGNIYSRFGTGAPTAWSQSLGKPSLGSAGPFAVHSMKICPSGGCTAAATRRIYLWTVSNGTLWSLEWNGSAWVWTDRGKPNGVTSLQSVRPSAIDFSVNGSNHNLSVFVLDNNNNLQELRGGGASFLWFASHGKPAGVTTLSAPSAATMRSPVVSSTPTGVSTFQQNRWVFVIGNNNKAYVRYTVDGTNWFWADQSTPYGNVFVQPIRGISAISYWSR
jgi:hypothetical protein